MITQGIGSSSSPWTMQVFSQLGKEVREEFVPEQSKALSSEVRRLATLHFELRQKDRIVIFGDQQLSSIRTLAVSDSTLNSDETVSSLTVSTLN